MTMGVPNPHSIRDGVEGKHCSICKQWVPLTGYHKRARVTDGLNAVCKECAKAATRRWYAEHRQKMALYNRMYHAAHRKEANERRRQRWWAHRDEEMATHKAWAKVNKAAVMACIARKRSRYRLAAGTGYTTKEHIQARWELYGGRCWICGAPATAIDHVKPISKGGANWPCNLRPICKSCNSKKHAKWPFMNLNRKTLTITLQDTLPISTQYLLD